MNENGENEKTQPDKGSKMEESLRLYFLRLGYFVVRGIKFRYHNMDITDIDLWLYNRHGAGTRERVNVDIKNKKTPQAIERIFWAKGVMDVLGLDSCIVATTDKRPSIREFGLKNKVTVIDGHPLAKIVEIGKEDRIGEEEFLGLINSHDGKVTDDWRKRYEESKARLLSDLDYSGCNKGLADLKFVIEKVLINPVRREASSRLFYCLCSHILITIDFIFKDMAFIEVAEKAKQFEEGIKYGNIGKDGLSRTVNLAVKLTGNNTQIEKAVKSLYDNIPVTILSEFFTKPDVSKNLFKLAKEFEFYAFHKSFVVPPKLPNELQSIISIFLDYSINDRKKFFEQFT